MALCEREENERCAAVGVRESAVAELGAEQGGFRYVARVSSLRVRASSWITAPATAGVTRRFRASETGWYLSPVSWVE